jgi:cell division protein ZapA
MEATSDTATGTKDGKNVVQVQILGQQLTIRGEADQDYILSVAQYVDRKMREVTEKLPVYSMSKVAILASLHIADELFKERANQSRVGTDVNGRAAALMRRLDEVLAEVSGTV